MRTTVELDPDTEAAVLALRQQRGLGVSESVNELIRKGLLATDEPKPYVPVTRSLGIRIDVSNIAEALDLLEGPDHR
jgi:hypothetical protein